MYNIDGFTDLIRNDLVEFAQELVKTQSYTYNEGEVIIKIEKKMKELEYDEVFVDKLGNVIGRIGNGKTKILFDGHTDTVNVDDSENWSVDPFGGEIIDGKLYGRGSSDMKSAVAAIVYAGHAIKKMGLTDDVTVYVSASVMEEDCDGGAILYEYKEDNIHPDYVVICEPTGLKLAVGQRGRASIKITAKGTPCHGSVPEKGDNPVYKVSSLIDRINQLNKSFMNDDSKGGSVALTKIDCVTGSINSVPSECSIYLDRRLAMGEDRNCIIKEMDELVKDIEVDWEIINVSTESWKGENMDLDIFFPAWEIEKEHKLTQAAIKSYLDINNKQPEIFKWGFSTNGVASMGILGIPTIGFGPSDGTLAHCKDEYCPVKDIVEAFKFYSMLPTYLK